MEVKDAGWNAASAHSAGYDVLSLVAAFGYDAAVAGGCDVSCILVSCAQVFVQERTRALTLSPSPPSHSARRPQLVLDAAS